MIWRVPRKLFLWYRERLRKPPALVCKNCLVAGVGGFFADFLDLDVLTRTMGEPFSKVEPLRFVFSKGSDI